jgi:dTDP-glucose 4,6-dehydratase
LIAIRMSDTLPPLPEADLARVFASVGAARWEHLRGARILLTGGTGFVGKWMLATLLDASGKLGLDCHITVLSRKPEAFRVHAPNMACAPGVTLLAGDVRHFEFGQATITHIIHAATDVVAEARPLDTFDTCVQGTRTVLDLAVRHGAAVLLVSSGAIYGRQPTDLARLNEDHAGAPNLLAPGSAYGEGKRAAEWLASTYASEFGVRVIIARCFAFVGPYLPLDKHFAVGNFMRDALEGQPIVIRGNGTPVRSYLYAADMAAWLWGALMDGRSGAAYNIGGEAALSILALAKRVVSLLQSHSVIKIQASAVEGVQAERYVPNVELAIRELKMTPALSLDEAIIRTAVWHRPLLRSRIKLPESSEK